MHTPAPGSTLPVRNFHLLKHWCCLGGELTGEWGQSEYPGDGPALGGATRAGLDAVVGPESGSMMWGSVVSSPGTGEGGAGRFSA